MRYPSIVFLALAIVLTSCIQEIPMTHRVRTEHETRMFIAYMNHDPIIDKVMKVVGLIFNHGKTIKPYSYPEEKIINYLDAQYYGYILF